MKVGWAEVVKRLNEEAQNIYMECSSCTSSEQCIALLPITTPISITNLNSCCSCLLNHILDTIPNISRMYLQSKTSNEYTIIYVLGDVIVETSEDSTLVIPVDKVHEFLEILKELDSETAYSVVKWLENEGLRI